MMCAKSVIVIDSIMLLTLIASLDWIQNRFSLFSFLYFPILLFSSVIIVGKLETTRRPGEIKINYEREYYFSWEGARNEAGPYSKFHRSFKEAKSK